LRRFFANFQFERAKSAQADISKRAPLCSLTQELASLPQVPPDSSDTVGFKLRMFTERSRHRLSPK